MYGYIRRYHLYLICIGQTTNEHLRRVYRKLTNPYNQGCHQNCLNICLTENTSLLPHMHDYIDAKTFIIANFVDFGLNNNQNNSNMQSENVRMLSDDENSPWKSSHAGSSTAVKDDINTNTYNPFNNLSDNN